MPFYEYPEEGNNDEVIDGKITDQKDETYKVPIFLIPGIIPHGILEFGQLAKKLRNLHPRRPIYVYLDDRIRHPEKAKWDNYLGVAKNTRIIAASMVKILELNREPYEVVGFSKGAADAAEVKNYLEQEYNQKVDVLGIDGTSYSASKKYFEQFNEKVVKTLINIVNYAGRLTEVEISNKYETVPELNEINLSSEEVTDLLDEKENNYQTIENALQYIAQKYMDLNSEFFSSDFETDDKTQNDIYLNFIKVAALNIQNIMGYEQTKAIDEITLLLTDETKKNITDDVLGNKTAWKNSKGGWEHSSNKITFLTDCEKLKEASHLELVTDRTYVTQLAQSIDNWFRTKIKNESLLKYEKEMLLRREIKIREDNNSDPPSPIKEIKKSEDGHKLKKQIEQIRNRLKLFVPFGSPSLKPQSKETKNRTVSPV